MKNTKIKKAINRRHAKAVRAIKKYWRAEYKKAIAQYDVAHAECVALYHDEELIALIAGENHRNQYGLEAARSEAGTIEQQWLSRACEALRRYLCATCQY